MAAFPRLIHRYYLYRMTNSWGFYIPVSIVYLQDQGFGLEFIALTQAVFAFALLAAEVPTGYLADRLGHRPTLALGGATRALGLGGYAVADAAGTYLVLHALFAVGWALRSGTADAWLYDLLRVRLDPDEYARIDGRGSTAVLVTSAVTAVLGGVLYGAAPPSPFLANAALAAAGVPLLATFPAVGATGADGPDPEGAMTTTFSPRQAVRTLATQFRRPSIRWVVLYSVLLFVVFGLSRTFEQPAFRAAGIPVAGLGVLYAGFKIVSGAAAATAGWFQDQLGPRGTLALAAPLIGVAYGSLLVSPMLVVPVMLVYRGSRTVIRPVRNQYLNDRLADVGRATVLSGVSMVVSLATGAARLIAGQVAPLTGPIRFLGLAGIGLAGVAGLLWLVTAPVRTVDAGRNPDPTA